MHFGFRELLVILLIALVLFGGKRVKNLGADLGHAMRGFRKALREGEEEEAGTARVDAPAGGANADAGTSKKTGT